MNVNNKGSFLQQDLKRAFSSYILWVTVLIVTGILLNGTIRYTNMEKGVSSTYLYIINATALSGFGPFAALFPAMGYGYLFCEEYKSGYFQMILSRVSWRRFVVARMITVALSGGCIVGIPFFVVCMIGYIQGAHGVPADGFMEGTRMVEYLEQYGDFYVLFMKILLGFLFGVMFALISFVFAILSTNRYVAMIAPFVLYESLWFILYDYPVFNPIYMLRGDDIGSYPLSVFMECLYILAAVILCWVAMKRKVKDE